MILKCGDHIVRSPNGIVIVTGPTGSGKTTTLYTALDHLWSPELNIATIEDPVEMLDSRYSQLEVDDANGLTFASGLRSILRQDPDIIMIGEIRDQESAEIAMQASLTGHRVLATMHTNDAPSAITRLLDLNIPPYLVRASLAGIVAQRLVRVLCGKCKRIDTIDESEWASMIDPLPMQKPDVIMQPVGCKKCSGIGFSGRTGIYEMLYVGESIRRLITPAADVSSIRNASLRSRMVPLRASGAKKIAAGTTTVSEIQSVVPPDFAT